MQLLSPHNHAQPESQGGHLAPCKIWGGGKSLEQSITSARSASQTKEGLVESATSTLYERNVQGRTRLHYLLGLLARWKQHFKYVRARRIARKRGATIGEQVVMPIALAKRANANLTIGSHTSIQTTAIDLRSPVTIGSHVIIGYGTEIITTSHNIDSPDWPHKYYGITIEDYAWIPTKVLVLPSCRHIGRGAVVSSGSVVVKDVEPMSVVGGNPAKEFKKRQCVHTDLVVESCLGGDYDAYRQAWGRRKKGKSPVPLHSII